MSSARYSTVCDSIRKELGLPTETSLYDMIVKFFDKYVEMKESQQPKQSSVVETEKKEKRRGRPKRSES